MAGLTLSLLLLASLTATNADSCNKPDSPPRSATFLKVVNQLRSLDKGNIIQSGIEVLRDFFRTEDNPEIGYVDPLYIETERIQQDDDEMNIDVNVSATTVKGLLGFEVTDVKLSLNSEKFQVDLLFPEISAIGKYSLLSTPPLQRFTIFGNGEFDLTATNLRIQIKGDIGKTIDGELFIENLKSELNLEAAALKVTGLLDNELFSEIASWSISRSMPKAAPYWNNDIDELLQIYAEVINDKFLKSDIWN